MAKSESREYRAMISDEGGVVRGRIPSTLVRDMGARAGDYMVFRRDDAGNVSLNLSRARKGSKGAGRRGRGGAAKATRRR